MNFLVDACVCGRTRVDVLWELGIARYFDFGSGDERPEMKWRDSAVWNLSPLGWWHLSVLPV